MLPGNGAPTRSTARRRFLARAGTTASAAAAVAFLGEASASADRPANPGQAAAGGYPYWVGPPGSGAPYIVDEAVGAQEAINQALTDVGRGLVFVAGGRYTIRGPIFVGTGQTLCGAGPHGTFLNAAAASAINEPMIQNRAPNSTRIVIRDLGLECARRFDYGVRLLQGAAPEEWGPDPNHFLHRVHVLNPAVDGIYLGTSGYSGGVRETKINDCRVHDAPQVSFRIQGASDTTIMSSVSQGGGTGFLIASGNTKLSMCKAFFTDGPGFRLQSGRFTVSGCESQDAQEGCGFELVGFRNGTLSGCTADSNGNNLDDRTSAGFYLEDVRSVRISGASYQRPGGNGQQRWGVFFGPNVQAVDVSLVTDSTVGPPFLGGVLGSPDASSRVSVIG
jgi:hypothetical protein